MVESKKERTPSNRSSHSSAIGADRTTLNPVRSNATNAPQVVEQVDVEAPDALGVQPRVGNRREHRD